MLWNGTFNVDGSEQSPGYFNARRFGFHIADQSDRAIAIDLLKLVLIHKPIAASASVAGLSSQRPKNRKYRRGGHHGKNDPKCHLCKASQRFCQACKGQGSRLPARILMIAPPARLHHGVNAAAMGVGNFAPWRRFTAKLRRAEQARGSSHLLRRAGANRVFEALGTGPQEAPRSLRN